MAVLPMQKVSIVAHHNFRPHIINYLQELGALEIRDLTKEVREVTEALIPIGGAPKDEVEAKLVQLKEGIQFLEDFSEEKKGFLTSFISVKFEVGEAQARSLLEKFDHEAIITQIKQLGEKLTMARVEKEKLCKECTNLQFFRRLDIPLSSLGRMGLVRVVVGTFSPRNFAEFRQEISLVSSHWHLHLVQQTKSKIYILLLYLEEEKEKIENLFQKFAFNKFVFPCEDRIPAEEIKRLQLMIKKVDAKEEELIAEGKELAPHLNDLKIVYDVLRQGVVKRKAERRLGITQATFVLEGWIRKRDFVALRKGLAKITAEAEVAAIAPEKGEELPVVIDNPKVFQPFEAVTKLYGLPQHVEMDPTMALASFFIIFFALCLTDAGYGIILALLAGLALKKLKVSPEGKKLIRLIFFGGIVSFFIGGLAGGWFGIILEELPASIGWLKFLLLKIRLVDPMKNLLGMLVFSLALGTVHVLFGILLDMIAKIREKDYFGAIFDDALWIYFILVLIFFGMVKSNVISPTMVPLANYLALAGAGLLALTQGRKQKNIFMKLGAGVLSLYNVISYLGNILSYSRLLALGLTTAGIAMALNTIALMAKNVPFVGYLIMAVILVFGHLFNLAISVLGAFIHSARLQYVEFYQHFFKGGGRVFKPFRIETEYVNLR